MLLKTKSPERVERFRARYWLNVFVLDRYRGANGEDAALSRPENTPATQHEQLITFMPAHLSPTLSLLSTPYSPLG